MNELWNNVPFQLLHVKLLLQFERWNEEEKNIWFVHIDFKLIVRKEKIQK